MVKDLKFIRVMAEEEKVPMFISSASFQLWKHAWSQGGRDQDHTVIVKHIKEMFAVEIKGS